MTNRLLAVALLFAAMANAADPSAAPPIESAEAAAVEISKGKLCTAVADKEPANPKDSGAEYEAGVERVYFWNFANVAHPPATVKHVWSHDGKPLAEVALELRHSRTRTWSSKKVFPGAWKVETVSPEGIVLAVAEFSVK